MNTVQRAVNGSAGKRVDSPTQGGQHKGTAFAYRGFQLRKIRRRVRRHDGRFRFFALSRPKAREPTARYAARQPVPAGCKGSGRPERAAIGGHVYCKQSTLTSRPQTIALNCVRGAPARQDKKGAAETTHTCYVASSASFSTSGWLNTCLRTYLLTTWDRYSIGGNAAQHGHWERLHIPFPGRDCT